uniref:Uncharacterized protein n=1 Tax=Arundo donax TaxID=35708 RepID=A0A0A9FU19_ARUDO
MIFHNHISAKEHQCLLHQLRQKVSTHSMHVIIPSISSSLQQCKVPAYNIDRC